MSAPKGTGYTFTCRLELSSSKICQSQSKTCSISLFPKMLLVCLVTIRSLHARRHTQTWMLGMPEGTLTLGCWACQKAHSDLDARHAKRHTQTWMLGMPEGTLRLGCWACQKAHSDLDARHARMHTQTCMLGRCCWIDCSDRYT